MSDQTAGIHVRTKPYDVNSIEAQQQTAEESLKRFMDSLTTPFQRERYSRFFEDLAKAQNAYIAFPSPYTSAYIQKLEALIDSSYIHKAPRLNLKHPYVYVLDKEGELEIGPTFAHMKKGATLTKEKAFALAMAIYLNPNAREGVTVTGTANEQAMLIAALDNVMALNPGAHKINILNRPAAPQPAATQQTDVDSVMRGNNSHMQTMPVMATKMHSDTHRIASISNIAPAHFKEPSHSPANPPPPPIENTASEPHIAPEKPVIAERMPPEDVLAHFHANPSIAKKIWQDIKQAAQESAARILEPQPDSTIEDAAERKKQHDVALKDYDEDIKQFWGDNDHLHEDIIKNASGNEQAVEMSDAELAGILDGSFAQPAHAGEPTRESVTAKIATLSTPETAAHMYDLMHDHLQRHGKGNTPTDVQKMWDDTSDSNRRTSLEFAAEHLQRQEKAKAQPEQPPVEKQIFTTPAETVAEKPAQDSKPDVKEGFDAAAKRTNGKSNGNGHAHANGNANGNGADAKPHRPRTIDDNVMREARIHIIDSGDTTQKGLREAVNVGPKLAKDIFARLEDEGVVGPEEKPGVRSIPGPHRQAPKDGSAPSADYH